MSDDKAPSRSLWGRPLDDRFVWGPDDIEIRPRKKKPKPADDTAEFGAKAMRYLGQEPLTGSLELVSIPVVVPAHESHSKTGAPEHVDTYVRHIDVDVSPDLLKLHPRTREVAPPSPLPNAPGDQFFYDLSPGAQAIVLREMAANGITTQGLIDEIKKRIPTKEDAIALGSDWYPNVNALAHGLAKEYGITPEQAAGVIANMSPKTEWGMNAEGASHFIQMWRDGKFKDMDPNTKDSLKEIQGEFALAWVENAWGGMTQEGRPAKPSIMTSAMKKGIAILNDPSTIDQNLSTSKVRSFYENIMDPHGTWDVTVDTHMAKIFAFAFKKSNDFVHEFLTHAKSAQREIRRKDGSLSKADTQLQGVGYVAIAGAVRQIAEEWQIAPDIIQAAYWLKVQKLFPDAPGYKERKVPEGLATPFSSKIAGRKL